MRPRRQVSAQFLAEPTTIGLLGGVVGAALGVVVVVCVAGVKQWTPVLDLWLALGPRWPARSWGCWRASTRLCGPLGWDPWTLCARRPDQRRNLTYVMAPMLQHRISVR